MSLLESTLVDLSRATRLKDVVFRVDLYDVEWITATLQTIPREHHDLQRISIHVPYYLALFDVGADIGRMIEGEIRGHWLGLDRLLVQLWESRSIRTKFLYVTLRETEQDIQDIRECIEGLLPEMMKRGVIDVGQLDGRRRSAW